MKQLFPLSLLLGVAAPVLAQDVTNSGATIALTGGATLYASGSFNNSGTLDMSNGSNQLVVGGNLVNASGATLAAGTGNAGSTVTLNGAAAQQLSLNGASLANLTVNNTSGDVTLPAGSNATVTGVLTLTSGMVTALRDGTSGAATLTLADGASMVGESGASPVRYVAGNLAAVKASVSGNTNFPNDISINPAAALTNLTVVRTAGLRTAQVSFGTSSTNKSGIDQIWQTSAPITNATVSLTWLADNDNGLTNLSSSQMWARTAAPVAGSDWAKIGTVQNAASSRTLNAPVPASSSFSFFTASTTDSPLPVTLVAFEAARTGDAALLTWRTASELNNDHFEVEMSVDGQTFRKIGQVAGQGTKVTATSYSLTDPRLLAYAADPVYYRLRQVDTDGKDSYSPVRPVQVAGALEFAIAAFPNPLGTGGTNLQVRTGLVGTLTLTGYDATGRLVFSRSADLQRGASALELPEAGQLAAGVYYVKATQAGQSAVLKLTRE